MISSVSIGSVALFTMLFAVINLLAAVADKKPTKPYPQPSPLPPAA